MPEVYIKDKDGREVKVTCDKEPVEKCKEVADKAHKDMIDREPKEK